MTTNLKYDVLGHNADHFGDGSSTISELSELSEADTVKTSDINANEIYDTIGVKTKPPRPPQSITMSQGRANKSRLSLDTSTSLRDQNELSTKCSSSTRSLHNYRSSFSVSAASIPFFQSEAYKRKRNNRLKALKNVRTKFRNIIEKDQETGSLVSASEYDASKQSRSSVQRGEMEAKYVQSHEDRQAPTPWSISSVSNVNPNEIVSFGCKKSDLQNELVSANKLIGMLAQQLQDLRTSRAASAPKNNDSFVVHSSSQNIVTSNFDLQRELVEARHLIAQLQVNRAWESYRWRQSISENAQKYDLRIVQYEKEVQKWKDRFEIAQSDNQRHVDTMRTQTKEAQDTTIKAQLDIARLVVKHQVVVEENQRLKEMLASTKTEKDEAAKGTYHAMLDLQVPTKSTDSSSTCDSQPCEKTVFTTTLCRKGREKLQMGREKLRRKHIDSDFRLDIGRREEHGGARMTPPPDADEIQRTKQDGSSHRQFTWRTILTR